MKYILKKIVSVLLILIFVTACAGRAANPVLVQQYGDHDKSCNALSKELQFIESEITRLVPETKKTGTNTALGVAGLFLIVPWFFMDFTEAEQVEVNAYRQRYNNLVIIAEEKECGMNIKEIPEFLPEPEPENKKSDPI
jgi:hypothetical protein